MGQSLSPVQLVIGVANAPLAAATAIYKRPAEVAVQKTAEFVDEKTGAKAARDEAKKLAAQQQGAMLQAEAEAKAASAAREKEAADTQAKIETRNRQKFMVSRQGGYRSTILTSPLGITGGQQVGGAKTLLGL